MALSEPTIIDLASRLHHAEQTRSQIRQFSLELPEITIEDAYSVQKEWVSRLWCRWQQSLLLPSGMRSACV